MVMRTITARASVPTPTPTKVCPGCRCGVTSQPKFWPKNPVSHDNGRNTVAMMVSCFVTSLSRFETTDR